MHHPPDCPTIVPWPVISNEPNSLGALANDVIARRFVARRGREAAVRQAVKKALHLLFGTLKCGGKGCGREDHAVRAVRAGEPPRLEARRLC
jgi:hypothetical protein